MVFFLSEVFNAQLHQNTSDTSSVTLILPYTVHVFASNFNFSDVWIHIFQCNPKRLQ